MRPGWWCGGSAWLARCVHPWFQSKEGTICNICIFGCKIFWSWILRRIGNIFALLAWQIVACQRMITGTGKTGLNVCVNNSYNNITITTWSWRNWSILSDVYIISTRHYYSLLQLWLAEVDMRSEILQKFWDGCWQLICTFETGTGTVKLFHRCHGINDEISPHLQNQEQQK